MEERDGNGEHIMRSDDGKGRAVTLGFSRAPPHLPPARAEPKFLASIARLHSRAFLQMQAEGVKMHEGGQALDAVQATKHASAAPRGPGWAKCSKPNTPLSVGGRRRHHHQIQLVLETVVSIAS